METPARDPQLWRMAKARARFKSHLFTYITVNLLLWTIWALTDRNFSPLPWPVWSTLFWGIGVAIQGFTTYGNMERGQLSEREYERLLRRRSNQL
ncbi:2TM domain-containing protein [Hymenobacter taeanensis]|uniref:2TM domain-containing protein n=1 Tax=Hymenobacter taeanensis TaxID=2735321 RepID=A0A6M6BHX5_9BACT|nr:MULTISPECIES: 2TM domain-containing protein [Hymenobacter]QJX47404.1 2TM domain-containing protein [Hymenobacter taeanensis]UOQ79258.1 2TM domain-containing protein [Hymenobacter sp. 5414T-23]